MTFRLVTILYLFALLAASLAVFGEWGILVALVLLTIWLSKPLVGRWRTLIGYCWIVLVVLLLLVQLLPAAVEVRRATWRNASLSHAKMLLLSIHNYESANGHLPPAYITDAEGTPLFSWRVAILPYIEGNKIYKQLHLDEAWDSPHNRPLLDQVDPSQFASPRVRGNGEGDGNAYFAAIVDSATIWPKDKTIPSVAVPDGISSTIAFLEVGGLDTHWAEPREVSLEEAVDLLTGQSSRVEEVVIEGYFTTEIHKLEVRVVGFLDGHAEGIGPLKHREDARALLTRAGREEIEDDYDQLDSMPSRHIKTIVHWDHIWGVAVWLALVLLPSVPAARRRIWPAKVER